MSDECAMTLGDKMKMLERDSEKSGCLDQRAPVIIRLDGCAFRTWTKKAKCVKPFDTRMTEIMKMTTVDLCRNVQSAIMAFTQSDEISIVLRNDVSEKCEPWFGNRIQKLCSITASMAGCFFNIHARDTFGLSCPPAFFDARVIFLPDKEEAWKCLRWRQNECVRNSISGLAQAHFSPKALSGKKSEEQLSMLLENGVDWNELPLAERYGSLIRRALPSEGLTNGRFFLVQDLDRKMEKEDFISVYDRKEQQEKEEELKIELERKTLLDKVNEKLKIVDPFLVASEIGHSEREGCVKLLFDKEKMSKWELKQDILMSLFELSNDAFVDVYKILVMKERKREAELKEKEKELEKEWTFDEDEKQGNAEK